MTTREFLRRLAAGDESFLKAALSRSEDGREGTEPSLDRSTRVLVELAALLAADAPTVTSAPRLALALDLDVEVEGWDGS